MGACACSRRCFSRARWPRRATHAARVDAWRWSGAQLWLAGPGTHLQVPALPNRSDPPLSWTRHRLINVTYDRSRTPRTYPNCWAPRLRHPPPTAVCVCAWRLADRCQRVATQHSAADILLTSMAFQDKQAPAPQARRRYGQAAYLVTARAQPAQRLNALPQRQRRTEEKTAGKRLGWASLGGQLQLRKGAQNGRPPRSLQRPPAGRPEVAAGRRCLAKLGANLGATNQVPGCWGSARGAQQPGITLGWGSCASLGAACTRCDWRRAASRQLSPPWALDPT